MKRRAGPKPVGDLSIALPQEFIKAVEFCMQTPRVAFYLTVFALCTYLGVACYMRLVSQFSGVAAITVTTGRKVSKRLTDGGFRPRRPPP